MGTADDSSPALTQGDAQREDQRDVLVDAARRGDPGAIQAIWQAHRRWVAAVLLAYKPRGEDLEDLLQDVAMTLVRKIHTIRDTNNVRAWLRVVAINAARASARKSKHREQPGLDSSTLEAGQNPMDDDGVGRLLELTAELSDIYREPLMLRALHGMRSKQIAEILDVPVATVDTRIARARTTLMEKIREADAIENAGAGAGGPRASEAGRKGRHGRYT